MPKICIVSDIHHGLDHGSKKGSTAGTLMADFTALCAVEQPDIVLDLGDRISDVDHATDLRLEREAAAMFAPIAAPIHHLCGNHDRDHLSVAENEAILGQSLSHATVELGGWTVVLFRVDAQYHRAGPVRGFSAPVEDLDWLADVLTGATGPVLIASHVPLSGHDQTGNHYFQETPEASRYPETPRLREILATARVPVLCIAGHVHWNTLTTVDGIPHLTLQSLTESFTTEPDPAGAMAVLDLSDDTIHWRVLGRDRLDLTLPVGQCARRWIAPRPRRS